MEIDSRISKLLIRTYGLALIYNMVYNMVLKYAFSKLDLFLKLISTVLKKGLKIQIALSLTKPIKILILQHINYTI